MFFIKEKNRNMKAAMQSAEETCIILIPVYLCYFENE